MGKTGIAVCLAAALLYLGGVPVAAQQDVQNEIQQIKQQLSEMDALKARLDELENKIDESQKTEHSVSTALKHSRLKIDGRIFTGLFQTGDEGPFRHWSTDINDAKLRFTFNPSKNVTIANRLSTSSAKTGDFDYFYLDYALSPTSIIRAGQRKIDVGQETWVDNPVENMLITNSVSHVSGYGTGLALVGKFTDSEDSPLYEAGFVNGSKGVMVRPSTGLPVNIKIGTPLPSHLFASASYFSTGKLGAADKSAIGIAEIAEAPAGATRWERKLWEFDVRYNYGNSGIRSLIPLGHLPPVMLGATYGSFTDKATSAPDRDGKFWFVEGMLRLSDRLYSAARYSIMDLDDGLTAKLGKSPVVVNSYKRTSVRLGYALTDLTQIKTEYTINDTSGGASDPRLNQWAVGIATKF